MGQLSQLLEAKIRRVHANIARESELNLRTHSFFHIAVPFEAQYVAQPLMSASPDVGHKIVGSGALRGLCVG